MADTAEKADKPKRGHSDLAGGGGGGEAEGRRHRPPRAPRVRGLVQEPGARPKQGISKKNAYRAEGVSCGP